MFLAPTGAQERLMSVRSSIRAELHDQYFICSSMTNLQHEQIERDHTNYASLHRRHMPAIGLESVKGTVINLSVKGTVMNLSRAHNLHLFASDSS